jgi:hypothetical protein
MRNMNMKVESVKPGMVLRLPFWGKLVPGKVVEVNHWGDHTTISYYTFEEGFAIPNVCVATNATFRTGKSRSKKFESVEFKQGQGMGLVGPIALNQTLRGCAGSASH